MLLLISDANVLIDVEIGNLLAPMFALPFSFAVPDLLFSTELEAKHKHLLDFGLSLKKVQASFLEKTESLSHKHPRPSTNDLLALVLAIQEQCPLLTGDKHLRMAALAEDVQVHGTIWLVNQMLEHGTIQVDGAVAAYRQMQEQGSRLPWKEAEEQVRLFVERKAAKERALR